MYNIHSNVSEDMDTHKLIKFLQSNLYRIAFQTTWNFKTGLVYLQLIVKSVALFVL